MAVNSPLLSADNLHPVIGIELGHAEAGLYPSPRKDLLVIKLAPGASVAGVFTLNRFCAAPVQLCKNHLGLAQTNINMPIRALVVNTGNANAGTGDQGLKNAYTTCEALAKLIDCAPAQVLPFSTGVILEPLPIECICAHLPQAVANLSADNWFNAAYAIMTTDTQPKAASCLVDIAGKQVTLTGISKGSGMIKPNMATMLGFIACDAKVPPALLQQLTRDAAAQSFNCITVDGDTSTNDSFILIATGTGELEITSTDSLEFRELATAVNALSQNLAHQIVRDGEGATKFVTILVQEGRHVDECRQVAYAIGESPLVKTALFAADPNLGRILAAIGYAGISDLDITKLHLYLNDSCVVKNGTRHPDYQESDGKQVMQKDEITIRVQLGRGPATATIWTCDLSHEYVSINAHYRRS